MSVAANLFNTCDPTQAELILADLWAKSAKAEGHVRRLPEMKPYGSSAVPRSGATNAILAFVKEAKGTFTIHDVYRALPEFEHKQVACGMRNAFDRQYIVVVKKVGHGVNVYRRGVVE